jgi:hypothetical protein
MRRPFDALGRAERRNPNLYRVTWAQFGQTLEQVSNSHNEVLIAVAAFGTTGQHFAKCAETCIRIDLSFDHENHSRPSP